MHGKRIITERLTLDTIRECDFDSLISIFKSEAVSRTYMKTTADEERLFNALLSLSALQDRYVYGIFLDGGLIGIINDTEINGDRIEVGYALDPNYFSMGYMTEALCGLIGHLFKIGFAEVICGAFDHNVASIRVMEKCGMTMLDKTDEIEYRGKMHQCIYYSIKRM